jgi:hypothetical protein
LALFVCVCGVETFAYGVVVAVVAAMGQREVADERTFDEMAGKIVRANIVTRI